MSVWGKVVGGLAGFALGGPLGALLGTAAGHAVDKMHRGGGDAAADPGSQREAAFSLAVIVLGAKMAKADGHVARVEIEAFKRVFHIPPEDAASVGRLFNEARRDATGFEPYARQVAAMFADDPAVLEELLGALFHIATADNIVKPAELDYLRRVAALLGFGPHEFERIRASNMAPEEADPYAVLGLPTGASNATVKGTYRKLIKENHPDALTSRGMPREFTDLANEKMAAINAAYDSVARERGIR